MKGHTKEHHERKHRETGGVNEAEMDLREKPEARTNAKKIDGEAEERKKGGRVRRKHGGEVHHSSCKCEKCMGGKVEKRARGGHVHHEKMEHMKHAKHVGHVEGEHAKHHAGRKPRKSGGSATSNPFSSARHGEAPKGHKVEMNMED